MPERLALTVSTRSHRLDDTHGAVEVRVGMGEWEPAGVLLLDDPPDPQPLLPDIPPPPPAPPGGDE